MSSLNPAPLVKNINKELHNHEKKYVLFVVIKIVKIKIIFFVTNVFMIIIYLIHQNVFL